MSTGNCKGFIISVVMAILLGGCISEPQTVEPLEVKITDTAFSFEGNEENGHQLMTYDITMSHSEGMTINVDSVEPLIAGWIEERIVEHDILELETLKDNLLRIKGTVLFDSSELSKKEMQELASQDESVQGILFRTVAGASYQAVKIGSKTELIEIGD
ncbi:hypothetical protein LC085_19305 [Bacillus tianshenii]|uniref:hypothetical protein n=1 Tax=Sutcliffiella tianshenii TaxID=1463404 RepID=UPI001CD35784|nr:hypothetical protein [Bacillus tianshenii]MCA1322037.1 hypothetical protein [Bacillus tianshenii]